MGYETLATKAGDQVIDAVERVEGMAVDTVSTVSKAIGGVLPKLPEIPYASELPHPRTLVETYFDFAQKWLKSQRAYFLGLVDAYAPVTEKLMPEPKPHRARPATTRKSSAKRAA